MVLPADGNLLAAGRRSCKKTGELLTVNESASFSASLQASVDSVTLAPANDSATVLTFTWPAVSYGSSVAVTYTLEMDVPAIQPAHRVGPRHSNLSPATMC